jgi:hypothetical protein
MTRHEFLGMVEAFNSRRGTKLSSGVREIDAVIRKMEARDPVKRAIADRPILTIRADRLSHGRTCVVTALSPSDRQVEKSLDEITRLMPKIETKRRATDQDPNDLTVAVWVDFGDLAILLGGDLEESRDQSCGWNAVLTSGNRPKGRASVFKVAHHGSSNGHNHEVWNTMLVEDAFAILAPWHLAANFHPTHDDANRILRYTRNAYATAPTRLLKSAVPRPPAVARQLREMGVSLRHAEPPMGAVRLRNGGPTAWDNWTVSLANTACHLSKATAAA